MHTTVKSAVIVVLKCLYSIVRQWNSSFCYSKYLRTILEECYNCRFEVCEQRDSRDQFLAVPSAYILLLNSAVIVDLK